MVNSEEKQKQRTEYHREWRKNNPEKVRENSQKFYENHPNYATNYYKAYYKANREDMRKKQALWRKENVKKDTVYFFEDLYGQTLYIGSSARFRDRISAHCTANSNLKMSAEEMVDKYNLDKIIYKDFTQYGLSRDDLYYIESYFKEKTEEIIKTNAVNCNEKNLTRSKKELEVLAESIDFLEFRELDRYLN